MKLLQSVIMASFFCGGMNAQAQVPENMSSSIPDQWQLTLDVIKSKAQSLVIQNDGLAVEYRRSLEQAQKLKQAIEDEQNRNEGITRFLKERHGRTDQEIRIGELTQTVKTKRLNARALDDQLEELTKRKTDLDRKIQQLKYTISDIELHQQAQQQKELLPVQNPVPVTSDDQLGQWRKQLEDQNRQEALLENELADLKSGDKTQNLNADDVEHENKQLESRLDFLRLQKLRQIKRTLVVPQNTGNARKYNQLKQRKDELLVKINAYALRLDKLRESSLMALSWSIKKKKLVHELVETDAHNDQMRDQIKELRENIDVLKEQVAKLERRVDFAQGNEAKQ